MKRNYVDLGLPSGLKWATCNIGASKPEEYGNYFAWGEVVPKNIYKWETYKWCKDNKYNLTKYNTDDYYGKINNKTVLDLKDDAAHVNWGESWRIPTKKEYQELMDNCISIKTNNYNNTGIAGQIVTSNINGNSIFLPATGYRINNGLYEVNKDGDYWTNSLDTDTPIYAWSINFKLYYEHDDYRYYGQPIRPVFS